MSGSIFSPTVEIIASKRLFGNWMLLGGETLERDYALVWAVLSARLRPLAGQVKGRYGLGLDIRRTGRPFPYWTAVDLPPGLTVPGGMVPVTTAAGPYLVLDKGRRRTLDEAYAFIYGSWAPAQRRYAINRAELCFESYGPDGLDQVSIFMPLLDRAGQAEAGPAGRRAGDPGGGVCPQS